MSEREDRWRHLVASAFALDEACANGPNPQAAEQSLRSVLEVFPAGIDPVEDFEAYAVRRMILALLRAQHRG